MLGVFEAVVPIIAGGVFTKLYNATAELDYPWHATYYFGTIGVVAIGKITTYIVIIQKLCHLLGLLLTIFVYLGTRKSITSEKAEEDDTGDTKL